MKLLSWFKVHKLLSIIIAIIVISVGGISTILLLSRENVPKLNPEANSTTLPDGTYSCELMYNGKSFDDDNVIREWLKKLAIYESSIDIDSINISDFRKGLFDEFGSNNYIVKDDNIVKLYLTADRKEIEYITYDIGKNQFTLNEELYSDSDGWRRVETILNNSIKVEQTKDSFTYSNFGFILIYPSIYNNAKNNASSDGIVNIDYDKYTGLGDLVCKTPIQNKSENSSNENISQQPKDSNEKYLGKYVGTGSGFASESYIELLENNKARVNINYCAGWSLYTGNYGFATTDYTDDDVIIYIDSFSLLDGDKLDMPDSMVFQVDDDKIYTLIGYLGSNNFDCGVSTTLVRK